MKPSRSLSAACLALALAFATIATVTTAPAQPYLVASSAIAMGVVA